MFVRPRAVNPGSYTDGEGRTVYPGEAQLLGTFVKALVFVLLVPGVGLMVLCGGIELWHSLPARWQLDEKMLRDEVELGDPIGASSEAAEAWCRAHPLRFRIVRDTLWEPSGEVPRLSAVVWDRDKDVNRCYWSELWVEVCFGSNRRVTSRSVLRLAYPHRVKPHPPGYVEAGGRSDGRLSR
jgi:hypothetical protein